MKTPQKQTGQVQTDATGCKNPMENQDFSVENFMKREKEIVFLFEKPFPKRENKRLFRRKNVEMCISFYRSL